MRLPYALLALLLPLLACGGRATTAPAEAHRDGSVDGASAPDATSEAVAPIKDAGVPDVPFYQWYYPDCGVPGECTNPGCSPVPFEVSPVGGCAATEMIMTGCLPLDSIVDGWNTFGTAAHQVAVTEFVPYTDAGVSVCGGPGEGVSYAQCCTWTDAGDAGVSH